MAMIASLPKALVGPASKTTPQLAAQAFASAIIDEGNIHRGDAIAPNITITNKDATITSDQRHYCQQRTQHHTQQR